MHVRVYFLAPSYIPRNFQLMQAIDGTTVQFAWDPPLAIDEVNIRGYLKAYQVIIVGCLAFACFCL